MTTRVLVMVPSFSLRDDEPNPCNVRLAEEALRICYELFNIGYVPVLVAQWEVDLALHQQREAVSFIDLTLQRVFEERIIIYAGSVSQPEDGSYLDTKEVYEKAKQLAEEYECTYFVAVAQPFIHQPYTYWLARKDFKLIWKRTRWIGFDKQSTQWWCRSWWQFLYQTVRLLTGAKHGHDGRQEP